METRSVSEEKIDLNSFFADACGSPSNHVWFRCVGQAPACLPSLMTNEFSLTESRSKPAGVIAKSVIARNVMVSQGSETKIYRKQNALAATIWWPPFGGKPVQPNNNTGES